MRKQRGSASQALREQSQLPKPLRYGALNRDERNQQRREDYRANKDTLNERRRQSSRELVHTDENTQKSRLELRRERYRDQSQAMSKEQLDRRREKAHLNYHNRVALRKERELGAKTPLAASASPTAEESAKNWLEYRANQGPGPTAEESARKWLDYRSTHGPGLTAEESAKNWLAWREAQSQQKSNTPEDDHSKTQRGLDHGL